MARLATAPRLLAGVPPSGRRTLAGLLVVAVLCTAAAIPLLVDLVGVAAAGDGDLHHVAWPLAAFALSLLPNGAGTLLVVVGRRRAQLVAGWVLLALATGLAVSPLVA